MLQRQFLNPYGFMQFNEATQEQMQMNMNPMMMNPVVMPPQMIRNSGNKEKLKLSDCDRLFQGYGQMQFPAQSMPMMMPPQLPNHLQLAQYRDQERDEELENNIDDAVAHYPSMMWSPQPVIYPMMMMMPMSPVGGNDEESQQRMMMAASNPPDVIDARFHNNTNLYTNQTDTRRFL